MPGKGNSSYGGQEHLVLKRSQQKGSVSQISEHGGRWAQGAARGQSTGVLRASLSLVFIWRALGSPERHGNRAGSGSLKLSLSPDNEGGKQSRSALAVLWTAAGPPQGLREAQLRCLLAG